MPRIVRVVRRLKLRVARKVVNLVSETTGRLFRRKDGKYLIYIPKDLAEDSMFPFKGESVKVCISFKPGAKEKVLTIQAVERRKPQT